MLFLAFARKSGNYPSILSQEIIDGLDPFRAAARTYCSVKGPVKMIQRVICNTPQSHQEGISNSHSFDGKHIVSWARLDNRPELGEKLGLSRRDLQDMCDSLLILHSYKRWAEKCVEYLVGDFAFAIYDEAKAKVFCARDHFGTRPFFYYLSEKVFGCSSSLPALLKIEYRAQKKSEKWIVDYLANLSMSFSETSYKHIKKVPPGHLLTVDANSYRLQCYFQPALQQTLFLKNEKEYVDAYYNQLQEAVHCRLASKYTIGVEASGGLDSSGITAIAAKALEHSSRGLHTFGFISMEREPDYIAALLRSCSFPPTHLFGWQELNSIHYSAKERAVSILGHPPEHESTTFHTPFYSLAQSLGIKTLLSGFGGDEFVTNVHDNLIIKEMLSNGAIWELYRRLPGSSTSKILKILKMFRASRKKRSEKGVSKYNPQLKASRNDRWAQNIMRTECIERFDLMDRFFEMATFDSGYNDLKSFLVEKRWHPFISTRLEQCAAIASSYGVEYRWPLLDVRLVNLYLAIPSSQNYFNGMGRYLHRKATEKLIPAKIAWNPGKNMGKWVAETPRDGFMVAPIEPRCVHEKLHEIVDLEKVQLQSKGLASEKTNGSHKYLFSCNLQRLHLVNQWLQRG